MSFKHFIEERFLELCVCVFGGIRRDQKDQRGMIKVRDYRGSMVQDLPNVPHPRVPLGMRLRAPCAHRV